MGQVAVVTGGNGGIGLGGYENDRFRDATVRRTPVRRWAEPSEFRERRVPV